MYLESLVTNSISVEQELRGARVCDTLLQSYFCSTGVDERLCTFTQTINTEVLGQCRVRRISNLELGIP